MGPRKPNAKAVAAKERKAAHQASKDAEAAKQREKQEAEEWKKGSNLRKQARVESEAQKADEAARRRREKAELLAAEEEAASASGGAKKTPGSGMSAKKNKSKKKKDEFSLLEDALVGDAEKKTRAAKRAERLRKEREERQAADAATKRAQATLSDDAKTDPLLANTDAMIGTAAEYNDSGGTDVLVGRSANVAMAADGAVGSGLDSALDALSMGGSPRDDAHPEKRAKALHLAFEEKMMPQMKEDYPGLRMTQYKEKIFALWKKSPENPMNWPKPQQSSGSPRKGK